MNLWTKNVKITNPFDLYYMLIHIAALLFLSVFINPILHGGSKNERYFLIYEK